MMELVEVLFKIVGLIGYFILAIWLCVTWVGMHNNTIDGNSFRLMFPFVLFDKSQFTEKGNYWRVKHLHAEGVAIIFSIIYWGYNYFA